jgi:hypothetical protein
MSAKGILIAMVVGSAVIVAYAALRPDPEFAPPPQVAKPEEPWLSREASEQIIGPNGVLGPVFTGIKPGRPAPSAEERTRIDSFARANKVTIDIATANNVVTTIRFSVKYGGCCGYEGADWLGNRLGRPNTGNCSVCGADTWFNDWVKTHDGVIMRAAIRVNRVDVRWDKEISMEEMLDRVDRLFGAEIEPLRAAEPGSWHSFDNGAAYLVELPYTFRKLGGDLGTNTSLRDRGDLGMMVTAHDGRVDGIDFDVRDNDEAAQQRFTKLLEERWGRPVIDRDAPDVWTWTLPDREIHGLHEGWLIRIMIDSRAKP